MSFSFILDNWIAIAILLLVVIVIAKRLVKGIIKLLIKGVIKLGIILLLLPLHTYKKISKKRRENDG